MNDFAPWLSAIYFNKLLLYCAFAMTVGGVSANLMFQRYEPQQLPFFSYATWGCVLGLIAASLGFLFQVGQFAESGLSGMWDASYVSILWQSSIGLSYQLRLAAWSALIIILIVLRLNTKLIKPLSIAYLVISLSIAASFTLVGHTSEHALWVKLALVLHIFCAMWWVGSLYPLRHWCQSLPINTVQVLMREFGKQASVLVAILLIAAAVVSFILVSNIGNLFNSPHGSFLLVKIIIVALLLAIAARHKFSLVPSLINRKTASHLRISITIEMAVAAIILVITAALSTLVGPSQT